MSQPFRHPGPAVFHPFAPPPAGGPAAPADADGELGPEGPPPARLTARMELFCQAYAERPVGHLAALHAGYAPKAARQTGSRLLRHPAIAERIEVLRGRIARAGTRERATLIAKLECVVEGAIEDRQWAAAARAVQLQAHLSGHGALRADPDAGLTEARADAPDARPRLGPPPGSGRAGPGENDDIC